MAIRLLREQDQATPGAEASFAARSRPNSREPSATTKQGAPAAFQRTFDRLENLLTEFMSVATQVVDHDRSRTQQRSSRNERNTGIYRRPAATNQHEASDSLSDVDLEEGRMRIIRNKYATQQNMERPRLANILDQRTTDPELRHTRSPARMPSPEVENHCLPCTDPDCLQAEVAHSVHVPGRRASLQQGPLRELYPVHLETVANRSNLVVFGTQYLPDQTVVQPHDAASAYPDLPDLDDSNLPARDIAGRPMTAHQGVSLNGRSHVSLRGDGNGFNLIRSRRHQPIAREWSPARKKLVATTACISTALIGILLGIYAGIVPSVQYYILDENHAIVYGNVGCFIGLALPTFLAWPLPLLHGRKPYILAGLISSLVLLFPQALSVLSQRFENLAGWRVVLLVPRGLMGLTLGFASMNFHSILTDLFGASLMSSNPHQEVVDNNDVRRHGSGMGTWLGTWTCCWLGSLGLGFLIGAAIIDQLPPVWGFYISIILLAVVTLLNIVSPEVRRSSGRRSVAEVNTGTNISRRVARGEVMMHRVKTGPKWWGEEMFHGLCLSFEMLRQPGFAVVAIYVGWIYAQVVLIIILLGSLASRFYRMRSPLVGLMVGSVAFGALLGIPFQKANIFSRARYRRVNTSRLTLDSQMTWTSHLLRRTIFALGLPVAGGVYTIISTGPPVHPSGPAIVAGIIGCMSCLAISECNGLIMETFDTSDLEPGMMGRPRRLSNGRAARKTNYSSFPRVTSGLAVCHTFAYLFAAGSSVLGGLVQRNLGQRAATGVVAGILLLLTVMLIASIVRFKEVQIIPVSKTMVMDRWTEVRRKSLQRRASKPVMKEEDITEDLFAEDEPWRPILMGNPVDKTRRVNILELGSMTRWTEIRKKNRLIDASEATNRAALDTGIGSLHNSAHNLRHEVHDLISRTPSQRSRNGPARSRRHGHHHQAADSSNDNNEVEMNPLGKAAHPTRSYPERECVMGQTVPEGDGEGESAVDAFFTDTSADEAMARDHGSHMMASKVRPMYEGPTIVTLENAAQAATAKDQGKGD